MEENNYLDLYNQAYEMLQGVPASTYRKQKFDEIKKVRYAKVEDFIKEARLIVIIKDIERRYEL